MKRIFDLTLFFWVLIILIVPIIAIALIIYLSSNGPIVYWSDRVGIHNKIFKMPKFRTMFVNAPNVATHLLKNPEKYITPIGFFLRKYSLDELPQMWSILVGEMSFVGPRPALFNQYDLIELRTQKKIHTILPGLTGWAQINGRDELTINQKVVLDFEYLKKQNFWFDFKILWLTSLKVIQRKGLSH
jgi:O-antigen biosynthesis protein WbqP